MSRRISLIFTPPDKRKPIYKFFKSKSDRFTVYDVDSRMCDELHGEGLRRTLSSNARNELEKGWKTNIEQIINGISKTEDERHFVLIGHALYFNDFTREFFSLFDAANLKNKCDSKGLTISHTVLLIDDIFDIFQCLTKGTELYGSQAFTGFLEELSNDILGPRDHLNWLYYCLSAILNWRMQEITLTQDISRQLGSRIMLWAIKQDPEVLLN